MHPRHTQRGQCGPELLDAEADSPLLSSPLNNFISTSTGSMELVGTRERKLRKVVEFEHQYRQPEQTSTVRETVKEFIAKKWAKFSCRKSVLSNVPIVKVLMNYRLQDLPNDIVAGLTSGTMMIPQGLAFALLSTLQPIIGLYISLFSSLTYFLLGTGQQSSFGCIAILSIMMGSILDRYETSLHQGTTNLCLDTSASLHSVFNHTGTTMSIFTSTVLGNISGDRASGCDSVIAEIEAKKLEVAGAVTFLCGIIFVVLGKIGFGKVTVFMSDSLVTGVTVGAAFHVGSSQLKTVFGLSSLLPRYSGLFKLLKLWFNILKNIHHSNVASILAAAICILLIYLVKRFINEKYKAKMRVPVPIELIVMVLATVVCYFGDLNSKYRISIVKNVPTGVPAPRIPNLSLGVDYFADGLVIIIVAFAQTVAIAKLMGLKHNYKVDSNQEMFALGMVNVVCSVFSGYISGASVSRTVVQDGAGGKTQIASLFAAALVLLVMLFIGPYFYYVPKIALSAIILVSLRSLFLKLLMLPEMWRKSKLDCLVMVITVTAVVVLDADIGLLVGVVASIFLVLLQSMRSTVHLTSSLTLGQMTVWRSAGKYFTNSQLEGIKVVCLNYPLFFVNAEITTNAIFKQSGLNLLKTHERKSLQILEKSKVEPTASDKSEPVVISVHELKENCDEKNHTVGTHGDNGLEKNFSVNPDSNSSSFGLPLKVLILDLSSVSFVDMMGVKALDFVVAKFQSVGVQVFLTNVCENSLDSLQKNGFLTKHADKVFLTVDSVLQHLADVELEEMGTKL